MFKDKREITFSSRDEVLHGTLYGHSNVGVVLSAPHPLYGGSRQDLRVVRVAKELANHNSSALCMDYGIYGKGVTEVENALDAISFMQKSVHSLGLFGYSFGALVASNTSIQSNVQGLACMSILRKIDELRVDLSFECPKLLVHGKRDTVASYEDFKLLFKEAKGTKEKLVLDTDHFYLDEYPKTIQSAAARVRQFFAKQFF